MVSKPDNNVTLEQMLRARENRAWRQQQMLSQFCCPLISFTMNIPGPVKNNDLIRRGFKDGEKLLRSQLSRANLTVEACQEIDEPTGCEAIFAVRADAEKLKEICTEIEDIAPAGRLFDMDVIDTDGSKLSRKDPRLCLICGCEAKECARSRRHSVEELFERAMELLEEAECTSNCETVASLAVRSLLYEVCVTPKPGLVDRAGNGSHKDMDIYTFMDSASVLWPYFFECAKTGRESRNLPAPKTFAMLRSPGKLAEGNMLSATGGINTHKGAVFSLGIVCGALGRLDRSAWSDPVLIMAEVSVMTGAALKQELEQIQNRKTDTSGERFLKQYGIRGIRGQAADGFPAVTNAGLPVLEKALASGLDKDRAGGAALLAILAETEDTNMIKRGGMALYKEIKEELSDLLSGGAIPSKEQLETLGSRFEATNLSPGGSADLMALCWLLHFLKEGE